MSTFQDRLRQMEEKYGSGATGSTKTGTGSSGSSDKSTRYQSLLAEMDAKYGGGTTGSGSTASTSSGKPTRYQSLLAEMDAKYGGTQPGTFGASAQGSYQGSANHASPAGSVFPYRPGYAALESDASIPGSGTQARSAFDAAMSAPDKQKEFGADSQWWQEHKKRYSAISESPEYQTYIQGVQQAKADTDAEISELESRLAQLESQDKGFLLNLINGVDTMGMVQDRATIEQKIKQLKEDSGRDDLSVRTEVEDLLHENRINLNYMTDDQWRMMGYLYKKYPDYADRRKAILDYASYIAYDINAREQQSVSQVAQNLAGSGFLGGALATAVSVPTNLMSGAGYINAASQFLSNKAIGEDRPVDYYNPSMSMNTMTTSLRGTVAQNWNQAGTIQLDEKEHPLLAGILNGKGLGDVYQLGVSMADSVAIAALTKALGLPEEVGAALLGGSAATQGMLDALDRGSTDGQALTMGFLNGAFEMLFEKYSIGELIKDVPSYAIKDVVKEALKQSGVEAWEEGMTTIGNTLADVLVMEDKSELETMIREYKRQGYSDAEAQALAAGRIVGDILMDATGGFISGGIMGGVYRGVQTNQDNRQAGKQVLSSNTLSQMQDLASKLDSESLRESASAVTDSSGTGKIGAFARKVADTAVQDIQNASTETEATEAYRKTGNVSSDSFARSAFDLAYLDAAQKIGFFPDAFVGDTTDQQFGADGSQKATENHTSDDSGVEEQTSGGNASEDARGAFEQYYEEAHSPDVETGAKADAGTGSESKNTGETASMERVHMRNLLKSGSVDADTAEWILKNPEFRKAFEAETGITVTGTEEQQKNLVINAAALYAERESIRNPNQTTRADGPTLESLKSSGEALGYSGATLTGFVAGYRGNISAEEYRDAYNGFYTYGKLAAESGSLSFDRAVNSMSVYARRLGNQAAMAAFNRGKADATSSRTARTSHRPAKKGTGTFTDKTTSGEKRQGYGALVNTLEKFSKKTGIDVELVDSLKSGKYKANGRILLDTMTIQLAADGDNSLAALGHEAGEYLLAYNPEGYAQVREQLLSWWVEHENANSIDALIKAYQERYQKAGQAGKTWNEAANEAVNDALGAMLTTEAGMERFVQWVQTDSGLSKTEQKSLFRKIGDMIRSVIDGLKKLLEGSKDTPMQKRILEMEISKQQEILDAFLKAVDGTKVTEAQKNTANGRKMTSVTYDDSGNLIPLSARFDDMVSDPRYSLDVPESGVPQEQQDAWESVFNADSASREAYNDMSSEVEKAERAAAEAVRAARKQGLAEGDLLGQMYRGRIEGQRAASLEERLKNAKELIRSLRQQISDAEKKGRADSRSIERLKRDLSRQESAIDASRKRLADYREGRNERDAVAKGRLSVEKKAKALAKMLTTNTDKAHVPEDLKDAVGQLLQSLDFSSKRRMEEGGSTYHDMDYDAMMTKVRNALAAHNKFDGEAGAWMDLPDGFLEDIQKHIDAVKNSVRGISEMQTNQVYRMNSAQLSDLAHILTVVKTSLENINSFYAQGRKQTVKQAADSTIRFSRKHGSASGKPDGWLRRQLEWDNTVPVYAFSRFGDGGNQVFQGTQDGWDKLSFNVRKILDFKKGVFTDQEAQEWGKQLHEITLESGDVVTMSTAQIMSLVCLSKRSQAVQHMMQGGIRIANIQVEGKPGKSDTLRQAANYNLTLADLNNIGNLLTDKQKSVAMEIQKFMEEQGSEWGNEVSMRRFGYRAFTESNYFPIASDPTNLPAVDPEVRKNDMFRLMNLSATKATMEKANNAIVISNIFEVFGDHMADMAKYNALTLPILDMMKWYNYVDRVEGVNGQFTTRSVQRSILDAYGEGAGNYITTFIKDLNGVHEFGRGEGFMSKFVSNYKAAAVGMNLRVAILQPTAYVRAWAVMEAGYLRRGLKMSARKGAAEMERYSGIGNWKSMGFYDTNVNRGIRQQLSGEGTAMDTVRDKSMAAAELMDKLTWGALWNACKLETMEKQGLSGEELMQETALRFREIVYKTQVVDSTMTRSQNMRSGSMAMKFATAFMSEPTLSYNLVMDAYLNFRDAQRSGTNLEKGNARKRMVRSFAAYAASALAGAIMESLADALRDDDDYESYLRKFWDAFWGWDGNLVSDIRISNKIPFFKDIASIFGGNTVDRMDLASFHDLKEAWDIWKETVELAIGKLDKPTSVTYYGNMTTYGKIYKALRAISGLSGIPLASSTREVITLWNNTAGILYPDLKVKTYDPGDEKEILNALEDGHITADAASQLLTEKVKDEKTGEPMSADDAYWKVKKAVTGYGKTGELETALESGDEQHIQDCVDEILAHGFEEKDIPGKITSAIRDLYTKDADGNTGEGRISREQAQNLLREFAGKEEKDIFWNLQVWDQTRDGVEDAGVYRDLYNAVSTGKNLETTVKFYLDNGIGKDTLSQRLSDEFRETYTELYRTDRSAADAMKRNLLDAYEALGYDRNEKEATIAGWVYDGKLSDALESGNDKSIQSTIKSMVADGYDEQDVPGKVSSLVKALYTKDSNGEIGSGRISRETAKKLLTTYADMDETDVFWALRDWDRIAAGETNVNRYDDLHQAVSTGKSIQQTVKFYLDNGIGKSTLSQNLTSTYKQQYIDLYYSDPKAASALKKRLLDAYVAMGYDRSKKAKVIDGWIADAKD